MQLLTSLRLEDNKFLEKKFLEVSVAPLTV